MKSALEMMAPEPNSQLVWASPRELLNIFQADEIGCHIITVTSDVLKKGQPDWQGLARLLSGNRADVPRRRCPLQLHPGTHAGRASRVGDQS